MRLVAVVIRQTAVTPPIRKSVMSFASNKKTHGSAVPEVDAAVHALFRGNSDELLKLKPFLRILSNRRDRTFVAYAMKWEVLTRSRLPPRRGNEIGPGEQNSVAMSIEINCGRWGGEATEEFYLSQFIDWFAEYNDAHQENKNLGSTLLMGEASL